jgi:hypothetical protein
MIPAGGLGEKLQGRKKGVRVLGAGCREKRMGEKTDCKHPKTRLIAKDQDAEYVECLNCGAILEAGELPEPTGFDESLSDA